MGLSCSIAPHALSYIRVLIDTFGCSQVSLCKCLGILSGLLDTSLKLKIIRYQYALIGNDPDVCLSRNNADGFFSSK